MYHNCSIDWLSVTTEHNRDVVSPRILLGEYVEAKGMMGYKHSYKFSTGVRHLFSNDRPEVHCIYDATTLASVREHMEIKQLVQFHRDLGHRVSRIDTAIDAFESGLTIVELARLWKRGKIDTRASQGTLISDPKGENGDTMYIGSRKRKRKLLRVYDKAKEQGQEGDWIRFEMQYGQGAARSAALTVSESPDMADAIIGMTAGFATIHHKVWSDIQSGVSPLKTSHQIPKSGGDTLSWLWTTIIPVLVGQEIDKPGIMDLITNEVKERVDRKLIDGKKFPTYTGIVPKAQ